MMPQFEARCFIVSLGDLVTPLLLSNSIAVRKTDLTSKSYCKYDISILALCTFVTNYRSWRPPFCAAVCALRGLVFVSLAKFNVNELHEQNFCDNGCCYAAFKSMALLKYC